jgi:hypothetical protein
MNTKKNIQNCDTEKICTNYKKQKTNGNILIMHNRIQYFLIKLKMSNDQTYPKSSSTNCERLDIIVGIHMQYKDKRFTISILSVIS